MTTNGSADAHDGQPTRRPRVLLAEDSPAMAAELGGLLTVEFEVVGVVRDGPTLVEMASVLLPDVVVTDIGMPGTNGLAAASAILACRPSTPIVFVTVYCEKAFIERALALGALGYVAKRDAADELTVATWQALGGHPYLSVSARSALTARSSNDPA